LRAKKRYKMEVEEEEEEEEEESRLGVYIGVKR
jgi:hypothetical protein